MIRVSSFLIIILITLFVSCTSNLEKTIEGSWSIDTMIYKQYEIRNCVLVNVIRFDNDYCELPTTENFCEGLVEYVNKGYWEVQVTDSIPLILKINTDNKIFSGNHQIIFERDEKNKLLKMTLHSDNLYVVCRKGLFNFDGNQGLIDDLVKMSH